MLATNELLRFSTLTKSVLSHLSQLTGRSYKLTHLQLLNKLVEASLQGRWLTSEEIYSGTLGDVDACMADLLADGYAEHPPEERDVEEPQFCITAKGADALWQALPFGYNTVLSSNLH